MLEYHHWLVSPPSRAPLMLAEALNIPLNLKEINTLKGEQLAPDFVKINPQHQIPTLVDDGFVLWESRAILTYLATKYGKGSALYPEEPKARALVDQRLYFDMGTLYQRYLDILIVKLADKKPVTEEKMKRLHESLQFLNTFLDGQQWVAGPNLTIADLSTVVSVSCFKALDVDIFEYSNIKAWYQRIESSAPGFHLNVKGSEIYAAEVAKLIKKNEESI